MSNMSINMMSMSEKMSALEMRSMLQRPLPHEVVRQMMNALESFDPEKGDRSWLLRTMSDLKVYYLRTILGEYGGEISVSDAMKAWDALFFEAVRRITEAAHYVRDPRKRHETLGWILRNLQARLFEMLCMSSVCLRCFS